MENMINIDDIIFEHERLNQQLKLALSTMQLSDKVKEIKKQIQKNQDRCPHISTKYNWAHDGKCPYCGKEE